MGFGDPAPFAFEASSLAPPRSEAVIELFANGLPPLSGAEPSRRLVALGLFIGGCPGFCGGPELGEPLPLAPVGTPKLGGLGLVPGFDNGDDAWGIG